MPGRFSRTEMLLGADGMERLRRARVAVFGIGGVGGHAIEALVRSGVGTVDIFDNDTVSETNLNRQIIATTETVGRNKTEVMAERAAAISPETVINAHTCFFMPETSDEFDFSEYDYIIDAIDTVTGKLEIIKKADAAGVPVISCMGTGDKLDPTRLEVTDIYKTEMCPLARVMRRELKKRGIRKLRVVYSKETPAVHRAESGETTPRRSVPGSTAFVPAAAGLIAAAEVVRALAFGN